MDVESKESLSVETYSSANSTVQDSTADLIQNQLISSPHTTKIIDKNITVDDEPQSFETHKKINHVENEPSSQDLIGSDSLQCQNNNTTNRIGQKLPTSRKENLCFQTDT